MTDPLALLLMALAAGGGRVNAMSAGAMVMAGITLLQRCAPLVQRMSSGRAGILLSTSPELLLALAACDGREALLLDATSSPAEIGWALTDTAVRVVFTSALLAPSLPPDITTVLLDDAPRRARVRVSGRDITVDLGSHHGLLLEGRREVEGRDEPCLLSYGTKQSDIRQRRAYSHRTLLSQARATMRRAAITSVDRGLALLPLHPLMGLTVAMAPLLLAGAHISTTHVESARHTLDRIVDQAISVIIGPPAHFASLVDQVEASGRPFTAPGLRLCLTGGEPVPAELQARFARSFGVELLEAHPR